MFLRSENKENNEKDLFTYIGVDLPSKHLRLFQDWKWAMFMNTIEWRFWVPTPYTKNVDTIWHIHKEVVKLQKVYLIQRVSWASAHIFVKLKIQKCKTFN